MSRVSGGFAFRSHKREPSVYDHEDRELVTRYEAEEMAAQARKAEIQAKKTARGDHAITEALLPVRRIMHSKKPGMSRHAFALAVMGELHRPLTKEERDA